jgi:F-type H+-transporting ATPase subunit epsilon
MSQDIPSAFRLRIITPRSLLADTDVDEVSIPSLEGYLGVLPGHRPLFTALGPGLVTYRSGERRESFQVRGGYAEVGPELVVVFAELSEDEEE